MANTPFSFPQFNTQGFPYSSLPNQLAASFVPPNQQFSNGSQYGRWNGVNNNAFGLFPNQFGALFGYQPGPNMAFQPPYGNNGTLGSNQGPGSNPGFAPTPTGDPKIAPAQNGYAPGMSADNFGPSPNVPTGAVPGGDQSFSLNRMPNGSDSTSAALQNLLASGRGAGFANALGLNQGPQSITVNDFNRVNAVNPGLAFTLASMGGGNFRNAIQGADNMSQQQMNSYANNQAYGNTAQAFQGLSPQNLALLQSMGIG